MKNHKTFIAKTVSDLLKILNTVDPTTKVEGIFGDPILVDIWELDETNFKTDYEEESQNENPNYVRVTIKEDDDSDWEDDEDDLDN